MTRPGRAAVALTIFAGLIAGSILMHITGSYEIGLLATVIGGVIGAAVWKPWKRLT